MRRSASGPYEPNSGERQPNVINAVLSAWKAKRPKIEGASFSVSAELQRAILGEIAQAVAAARAELGDELADLKDTLATTSEELQQQAAGRESAELQASAHAAEIERQNGTITTLQREIAEAREQIGREREAAERARLEAAEATVQLRMVVGLQAEVIELRERARQAEIEAAELRGPKKG